jgi:hypothetical protein
LRLEEAPPTSGRAFNAGRFGIFLPEVSPLATFFTPFHGEDKFQNTLYSQFSSFRRMRNRLPEHSPGSFQVKTKINLQGENT